MGVSHRTSLPIAKPVHSSIREHCETSDHRTRTSNFSVVASFEDWNLRILESIYILNNKPLLNIDQSATPYSYILYIQINVRPFKLYMCMYVYKYIYTRETPAVGGISLALRRRGAFGAPVRAPAVPIWATAAFGGGEKK